MKKLIDIRTGQAMFYSARTIKGGKLPKYLVEPSAIEKKKKEPEKVYFKAEETFEKTAELLNDLDKPDVEEIQEEVVREPTPTEMKAFLKEKGIKFSPNIGTEKLTEKYEAAQ